MLEYQGTVNGRKLPSKDTLTMLEIPAERFSAFAERIQTACGMPSIVDIFEYIASKNSVEIRPEHIQELNLRLALRAEAADEILDEEIENTLKRLERKLSRANALGKRVKDFPFILASEKLLKQLTRLLLGFEFSSLYWRLVTLLHQARLKRKLALKIPKIRPVVIRPKSLPNAPGLAA